jgi:hypothetical protein
MRLKPGGRELRFTATEDLEVRQVGFSWRARFPLGLQVVDGYANGAGALEVRFLGLLLRRESGPELSEGEALRYLAELPWVPYAMVHNSQLVWHEVDERTVEVTARRLTVRFELNEAGDPVRAWSGMRRFEGKPTPWAGEYRTYEVVGGIRLPTKAEVYWELESGRFTYWRGRVLSAVTG